MPTPLLPTALTTAAERRPRPRPSTVGDTPQLETALLRRCIGGMAAEIECCGRCERHMLTGERVYEYAAGELRCALCSGLEGREPQSSRLVHTAAFGHSLRLMGRRAA